MTHVINVDLAKVWSDKNRKSFLRTLVWGDAVEVQETTDKHVRIATHRFVLQPDGSVKPQAVSGFIVPTKDSGIKPQDAVVPKADDKVLRVNFVDVQQGDGCVIETARGKVVLIDGGDNQLFARYLAGRFRRTTKEAPKEIDCIVVTHGDADHFAGLTEIHKSEDHETAWKRLFIHPARVYHNGLVKRPSTRDGRDVPDTQLLGATKTVGGRKVIVGLESNLLEVPPTEMNKPFKDWRAALTAFSKRGPIQFRRLQRGDHDAFDFLRDEQIDVQVLAPLITTVDGKPGLRFLGKPAGHEEPHVGHDPDQPPPPRFTGASASHTINGHSIVLRLGYGAFRFLFAGDLNEEAEFDLVNDHREELRAEVLKVPHHGSADFSGDFLKAVAPVLSVVSSGDESSRKEYIHPRASLMGALASHSPVEKPLILVTEMVAFFEVVGAITPEQHKMKDGEVVLKGGKAVLVPKPGRGFFAFQRTAFGLVKVRTDGNRLLVCTDSGNVKMKEAYAYQEQQGRITPAAVRQA